MDRLYDVKFSGRYIFSNEKAVEEKIKSVFKNKSEALLKSIAEESILKEKVSLFDANKLKTTYEKVGIECLIIENSYDIEAPQKDDQKKVGVFIFSAALGLCLIFFLISDGYDPRGDFLYNLFNTMYIFKSWFCLKSGYDGLCISDISINFYLKDILVFLVLMVFYGGMTYLGVLSSFHGYLSRKLKRN